MLRNTLKTTILLAGLTGLMVGIGSLFGRTGAVVGLIAGILIVGLSYWKSDALAVRAARAVPADETRQPEYFAIMRSLATRAEIPVPRLYISPEPQPNAFATGRNPQHAVVAVTQGLLDTHVGGDRRRARPRAVACPQPRHPHRLGRCRRRDRHLVRRQHRHVGRHARGRALRQRRAPQSAHLAGGRLASPIAAALLQMALSRSRDLEADRSGAALVGTGEPLARPLEKLDFYAPRVPMQVPPSQAQAFIVNPLTGRHVSFANLFRTHPTTAERVARLRGVR